MKQKTECIARPSLLPREGVAISPSMLINEISRLFFDYMRATDPQGSVLSQHGGRLVLLALFREDRENPASEGLVQRDLVRITHLKAPTVSGILQTMEEEGLACRTADATDGRRTRVRITEKGRQANEEIRARLHAAGQRHMAGLSEEEQACLTALLLRVRENALQERGGEQA